MKLSPQLKAMINQFIDDGLSRADAIIKARAILKKGKK